MARQSRKRAVGLTAKQMEAAAAALPRRAAAPSLLAGEAASMLVRRGFRPSFAKPDLPFPRHLDGDRAERLAAQLSHYAFRLFLRGAILREGDFAPEEATQYVTQAKARSFAQTLVDLKLAKLKAAARYRMLHAAKSFGGTLEWYVGRELRRRLGFDIATGLKFRAQGVGGDLDVVAAADGKLVYLELKSSPPKHLSRTEVAAFFSRINALRPDVAIFAMDTALRLSDKVLPMLNEELRARAGGALSPPQPVAKELWALTSHLYTVNAQPDLVGNICRAIAEGLRALSPPPPWCQTPYRPFV